MKILLVICFLGPFIYFGYLMSRLDKFLENNAAAISDNSNSASAIILGRTDLAANTTKILEDNGIHVISLADPFQLIREQKLYYMLALSENDADNIAFCKLGKKLYGIDKIISLCNDKRNEYMFVSENLKYFLNKKTSVEDMFQHLQQIWGLNCEIRFK